jgi:Family of unknown function (DUF6151)
MGARRQRPTVHQRTLLFVATADLLGQKDIKAHVASGMNSSDHLLQCRCGRLAGVVAKAARTTRAVCYCRDCQAYAHALGNPKTVLDHVGGTEIVATLQQHITLTKGVDSLACLSLSERGLLRWYASCCNTPIANTARNAKLSYVGLVHTCLGQSQRSLDAAFGSASAPVNTKHAKGPVTANRLGSLVSVARIFASVARARLDGTYKRSPFFVGQAGTPVVTPRVLSAAERAKAMNAV